LTRTALANGAGISEHRRKTAIRVSSLTPTAGRFRTLVIDPPWDYGPLSIAGRAAPLYAVMTHDELLALRRGWPVDG
jgi:hypothetical protein